MRTILLTDKHSAEYIYLAGDTIPELHLFAKCAHNLVPYLVHGSVAVLAARRLCTALVQFCPQPRDLVT